MTITLLAAFLLSIAAGVAVIWQLHAAAIEAQRLEFHLLRLSAEQRELVRTAESRAQIGLVQHVAETVIEGGTRTTRDAHKQIADVSFDVFESIPVTRETAKLARSVHDTAANLAYGTVSALNKGSGKGLRKLMKTNRAGNDKNADK